MSLFNTLFGNKENTDNSSYINWIPLTSLEDLEKIKKESANDSVLIFKHSTRCGISSMVKRQFEGLFAEEHQSLKVYYLDLLNFRAISNEIELIFNIVHQSPQLLVIKNQNAVFSASHYDITEVNLTRFL